MNEKMIFAEGIRFFKPNEKVKEFIKGNIVIDLPQFINFCEQHADNGKVRLDLRKSKEKGTLYLALNTWKKPNGEKNDN